METIDLIPAKQLMAERFKFLSDDQIYSTLQLCAKNDGLTFHPKDNPDYLFGFYHFYPPLMEAIYEQDYYTLMKCDLREGPLIYIAAIVLPEDGYRITWRLIESIPGVRAIAFHRYKRGMFQFHLQTYSRWIKRFKVQ